MGAECKLGLLTPRHPLFIPGDEGRSIKPRKPGIWDRKAAALRASPHCGQRMRSLLLAGVAQPKLRQAAPLSVHSARGGASQPHTKQILGGFPGFPSPSLRPPEVEDKEMRHYVCKWEAACVIEIECVRLRVEIDDREDCAPRKGAGTSSLRAEGGMRHKTDEVRVAF